MATLEKRVAAREHKQRPLPPRARLAERLASLSERFVALTKWAKTPQFTIEQQPLAIPKKEI
jgi:DNA-binding HxlR family transcriptional regulator